MFESARAKVSRAQIHIDRFNEVWNAFVKSKPYRFEVHKSGMRGDLTVRVRFLTYLPLEIPFVIADAIHNLRTALDQVAWELAGIGGGVQNRDTRFVVSDTRQKFERACKLINTPSQWVKDAMLAQEAFTGGRGHALWMLHELDVDDKHHVTAPVLRTTRHPEFQIISPNGGVSFFAGNIYQGTDGEDVPLVHAAPGSKIIWNEAEDAEPVIFCAKPDGVMEPPWSMLRGFLNEVSRCIAEIEARVPN